MTVAKPHQERGLKQKKKLRGRLSSKNYLIPKDFRAGQHTNTPQPQIQSKCSLNFLPVVVIEFYMEPVNRNPKQQPGQERAKQLRYFGCNVCSQGYKHG